jgi:hypothetical protein
MRAQLSAGESHCACERVLPSQCACGRASSCVGSKVCSAKEGSIDRQVNRRSDFEASARFRAWSAR